MTTYNQQSSLRWSFKTRRYVTDELADNCAEHTVCRGRMRPTALVVHFHSEPFWFLEQTVKSLPPAACILILYFVYDFNNNNNAFKFILDQTSYTLATLPQLAGEGIGYFCLHQHLALGVLFSAPRSLASKCGRPLRCSSRAVVLQTHPVCALWM